MGENIEPAQQTLVQQANSLPLSPEQQCQLSKNKKSSSLAALSLLIQIDGKLDEPRLQRALQYVLASQLILGSRFFTVAAFPGLHQSVVLQNQPWPLECRDQSDTENAWQNFIDRVERERVAGFASDDDWLATVSLCQVSERRYGFALVVADLITDRGGLHGFWLALQTAYKTDKPLLVNNEGSPQYKQYTEWRIEIAQDEDAALGREYWQQHLAEQMQVPGLPYRNTELVEADNTELTHKEKLLIYSSVKTVIDGTLQAHLDKLAQAMDQPLTLLLQAAWWWLLARISDQYAIQVGWCHDCRQDYEFFADNVGLFEKILPLSLTIAPEQTFSEWVETIVNMLEDHQVWQEYWSVELPPTTTHFACGFGLKELFADILTADSQWTVTSVQGGELPFELSLLVAQLNGKPCELELRYQNQHYLSVDIKGLLEQYQSLLINLNGNLNKGLGSTPDISLAELSSSGAFIGKKELKRLQHFEDTEQALKQNKVAQENTTLGDYISVWAKTTPDYIALTSGGDQLTYGELETKVKQLATRLHKQGVTSSNVVALALPRSINLVLAILATWRVGATWVPLDLHWPLLRKGMIIKQSRAVLTISNSTHWLKNTESETPIKTPVLLLDESHNEILEELEFEKVDLHQAAYIIFTSGSTGTPKGVVIEHRQLINYVVAANKQLGLAECKSYAMTSTVAADLGHTTLFGALFNGAALHIASDDDIQDGSRFYQFMLTHQIDCLKIVPSHLNALLDLASTENELVLPSTLILGGEPIPASLVTTIFKIHPACQLFNHYGPTETTVGVLYHQLQTDEDMEQGIPLSAVFKNCKVVILDEKMQRVPTGAVGELYIGGQQLFRGYLLSEIEDIFIDDPFNSGERLYPSGDLARYLPSGRLLLCGRRDHQVKIRGFRIELAEVEQVLLNEPDIVQAVVSVWQPGKNKGEANLQLIAYVQRQSQGKEQKSTENWLQQIIENLAKRLPATMLPSHVFSLENIPRLSNGKIDRKSLPSPESLLVSNDFIAPSSALETLLAEEMTQLLNLEKISTQQSFFSLGGHSLLIIKLVSRLRKQLQIEIHPGLVFDNPSVVELAQALKNDKELVSEKLERTAQLRLKLKSMTPEQREALLAKSKAG